MLWRMQWVLQQVNSNLPSTTLIILIIGQPITEEAPPISPLQRHASSHARPTTGSGEVSPIPSPADKGL